MKMTAQKKPEEIPHKLIQATMRVQLRDSPFESAHVSIHRDCIFFPLNKYFASLLSALPFTILYAVSNVGFLLLLRKPVGNKLNRVKLKYGV